MSRTHTLCADVPNLDRLNYFYGQMLGVQEFAAEQSYFREKLKLHNRCLHGYGAVCGLDVVPEPIEPPCPPAAYGEQTPAQSERMEPGAHSVNGGQKPERHERDDTWHEEKFRTRVQVLCGLALDCEGNELVVRRPILVDLLSSLSRADRKRVEAGEKTVWVSVCYHEQPIEPMRPVIPDACGSTAGCAYGKLRDSVCVNVTLDPPKEDERCEPCCAPGCEPCLTLARIDNFVPGQRVQDADIHNEVRRMLGPYTPTVITGISWTHGAEYSVDDASLILGTYDNTRGIEIEFSREVEVDTLKPGVIDVWVLTGGRGFHGPIIFLDGHYIDLPASGRVRRVKYGQTSEEPVNDGDRVLIVVRSPFILDRCCYPVAGAHIGGHVPIILPEYKDFDKSIKPPVCERPPRRFGRWTTDPLGGPVNFESWFTISRRQTRSMK